MLQQILKDMYVDPELLAELDEEQKQILFCKMREEQVRRWKETETALESQERNVTPRRKKPGGRCVDFKSGSDGQPWVWVMGEHKDDRSIEEIIEAEQQSKASKMAEEEAELLRKKMEEELRLKMQEEEEKLEEERRRKEELQRKKAEEIRLKIEEDKKLEVDKREQEKRNRKEKKEEGGQPTRQEKEDDVFAQPGKETGREPKKGGRNVEDETRKKLYEIKEVRVERRRKSSLRQIETLREQRRSQLYMSFKEARDKIAQLAEEDSHHLQEEWELQEQRARVREAEMRAIARRARQEHSVCSDKMRTESQLIDTSLDFTVDPTATATDTATNTTTVPNTPTPPRPQTAWPAKPANRAAVIEWFHESERPRGVGIDPLTQQPLPWFHGIIVRRQAEELLVNRPLGSFLVRVSERVRGYAISYRASDRCKHYLIDTLDGHYQFFGANQVVHNSLADLVCFHKKVHITKLGKELLLYPCGQSTDPPDYADLFAGQIESSQL